MQNMTAPFRNCNYFLKKENIVTVITAEAISIII